MNFGQRLKSLRLERSLTQQELASAVGVSVVAVRNWEHNSKKPTMDALLSLGHALQVSIDTILGFCVFQNQKKDIVLSLSERTFLTSYRALDSHGQNIVRTICSLEKERVDALTPSVISNVVKLKSAKTSERFIPRYTTPAAAGTSVPLDGADFEMILVDDSVPYDADYAVDIQGDSMCPYIHDGDMVYVKKDCELSVGDIGIFCVDGAMYCKQYYVDERRNLTLVSSNPKLRHTNVYVSANSGSDVRAYGKVLLNKRVALPDYLFEG